MDYGNKRKNVLDLYYQKYLILASTSIILAFSYFIGVGLAVVTNQIDLNNYLIVIYVIVISFIVWGFCFVCLYYALNHLRRIPKVIMKI